MRVVRGILIPVISRLLHLKRDCKYNIVCFILLFSVVLAAAYSATVIKFQTIFNIMKVVVQQLNEGESGSI